MCDFDERLLELNTLSFKEHQRVYQHFGLERYCSCVFSQEEIERLVELTKEPSDSF